MESVVESVRRLGGAAPRRLLLRAGVSPQRLATATRRAEVVRVRQGWYADPLLSPAVLAALRVGGSLTASSAGPLHGLWTLGDGLLHVAVPPHSSRLRSPSDPTQRLDDPAVERVCLHWTRPRTDGPPALAPLIPSLVDALCCQPTEHALVMLDSALNQRMLTRAALRQATVSLPAHQRWVIEHTDAGCQSGTETLVRWRLQRLGVRVQTQFQRPGVGHVDLLVGDRLVIECDSHFHDEQWQAERDYDRDIELVDQDYLELRLRYRHILYQWVRIERVILGLIRRRRHLWPRHR